MPGEISPVGRAGLKAADADREHALERLRAAARPSGRGQAVAEVCGGGRPSTARSALPTVTEPVGDDRVG